MEISLIGWTVTTEILNFALANNSTAMSTNLRFRCSKCKKFKLSAGVLSHQFGVFA